MRAFLETSNEEPLYDHEDLYSDLDNNVTLDSSINDSAKSNNVTNENKYGLPSYKDPGKPRNMFQDNKRNKVGNITLPEHDEDCTRYGFLPIPEEDTQIFENQTTAFEDVGTFSKSNEKTSYCESVDINDCIKKMKNLDINDHCIYNVKTINIHNNRNGTYKDNSQVHSRRKENSSKKTEIFKQETDSCICKKSKQTGD